MAVKGLYGFGFAYPHKVILPDGEIEDNVGLYKFGNTAKKWMSKMWGKIF